MLVRVPAVQNFLLPIIRQSVSQAIGTPVEVKQIALAFPDYLVLEQVVIRDQNNAAMIVAKRLSLSLIDFPWYEWLDSKQLVRSLAISRVVLDNGELHLYERTADNRINIDFLFRSDSPKDTTSSRPVALNFPNITIRNFTFSYTDSLEPPRNLMLSSSHMNYFNIQVDSVNIDLGLQFKAGEFLSSNIKQLSLRQPATCFHIDSFRTQFYADFSQGMHHFAHMRKTFPDVSFTKQPNIHLHNTRIKLGNSLLNFDAVLSDENLKDLFTGQDPKDYRIHFRESWVDFHEINHFIPVDSIPMKGLVQFKGDVSMNLHKIRTKNLEIHYGKDTYLNADVSIRNFASPNLYIVADLSDSYVSNQDLISLLPTVTFSEVANNLGRTKIDARFSGFVNDFVADGKFISPLGAFVSNINLKIPAKEPIQYKGWLETSDLNLDSLLGTKNICNRLNFKGSVSGSGFDEKANLKADFFAIRSNFRKHSIDSVAGSIIFDQKLITGNLLVIDHEGSFNTHLEIDYRQPIPHYKLLGDINKVNLNHYELIADSLLLTSIINLDLYGDSLDKLNGDLKFFNSTLLNTRTKQEFLFKNIIVHTLENTKERKQFELTSGTFNIKLNGRFTYAHLYNQIQNLITETELFLRNNPEEIATYYAQKKPLQDSVELFIDVEATKVNQLFTFLKTKYSIKQGSHLQVFFKVSDKYKLELNLFSDSMAIAGVGIEYAQLDLRIEKDIWKNSFQVRSHTSADKVMPVPDLSFTNIQHQLRWENEHIRYQLTAHQPALKNEFRLNGAADFTPQGMFAVLDSADSYVKVGTSWWSFSQNNLLTINKGNLHLSGFSLSYQDQRVLIDGDIQPNIKDYFQITFQNVSLAIINKIYPVGLGVYGSVNLVVTIQQLFSDPLIVFNGRVNQFQYGRLKYGDIVVKSDWNNVQNRLALSSWLLRQQDTLIGLSGFYNPKSNNNSLDFQLSTHNLPLKLAQPFIEEYVYDLNGKVFIKSLHVGGTLTDPNIEGAGNFSGVNFGLNYFKTKYHFDGRIQFTKNAIIFPELILKDYQGHQAKLNGYIYHSGLKRFRLDLQFSEIKDFTLMNTTAKDNELFYGRAIIREGVAALTGTPEQLEILADVVAGKGTEINIPISEYNQGSRLDFVYFKGSVNDSALKQNQKRLTGISLNLSLEINSESTVNIIFDEKIGDIIKGKGNGDITLTLNREGDFNMFGQYEIEQGEYLFTAQNVLMKKFVLEPGGLITWNGNPYDAQLNINAEYWVNASIQQLDTTVSAANKIPIKVAMHIHGSLFSPHIELSILMPNLNQQDTYKLLSILKNIENDAQELNRQVFSLLFFGRFAPTNSFFGEGGAKQGVSSSLSELISSQLNNWLGQAMDEKIGLVITSSNFNDLNLALKARLFNDRVSVERYGAIVNSASRDLSVGNINILIRILPKSMSDSINPQKGNTGTLVVEIFTRESVGLSNAVVSINRGVGIFYKKDFDKIAQLFSTNRKRKKNQPKFTD